LANRQNAQGGGINRRTAYLYRPGAKEKDLHLDLMEWFDASGLYGLSVEAQEVGGGRIDLMFTFDGFRFVIELKREEADASHEGLKKYLRQAGAYQVTDIAVGMLMVLDLTASPVAPHLRDNVWVDLLRASEAGGTDRHIVVLRVPGNRTAPSRQ
jgi:hypothetical protein